MFGQREKGSASWDAANFSNDTTGSVCMYCGHSEFRQAFVAIAFVLR